MKATIKKEVWGSWEWRIGKARGHEKTQAKAIKAAKKHADTIRLRERLDSEAFEVDV